MPELVEDLAWLDDARIDDAIACIETFPADMDQTVMAKQSEVLREIRFRQLRDLQELFDRRLAALQDIQDLKTLGIRQDFVDAGILHIGLFRQR